MVYVLNKNGGPLMPAERHGKVKVGNYKQDIILEIDAGSRAIGISTSTEIKEPFSAEVSIRSHVVKLLSMIHDKAVGMVYKLLSITALVIETASFDIQKIKKPEISGSQSQECFITGRYTSRYFALKTPFGRVAHNSAKYTDLRLIQKANTFIFERMRGVSFPTYAWLRSWSIHAQGLDEYSIISP